MRYRYQKYFSFRNQDAKSGKNKAQGMVEFVLVLPILLVLVLGIIEFGRLLFMYAAVTSASREGARYGASTTKDGGSTYRYEDCAGIRDAATRIGGIAGVTNGDITIQYDDGSSIKAASCPPGVDIELADRIIVVVTRQFTPIVPLVNLPGFPLNATTTRTIITDVGIRGTPPPTQLPPGFTPQPTAIPTSTPTSTDTATATATDLNTPTNTLPPTNTGTPTNTATPTNSPTVTDTPTPGASLTPTPSDTPTATQTPTDTPTVTYTPTATPIPACNVNPTYPTVSTSFRVDEFGSQSFYSVYLGITNNGPVPVTITEINLIWPAGAFGSEAYIQNVRFDGDTGWKKSCNAPKEKDRCDCIWEGDEAPTTYSICDSGCDGTFSGDRQLTAGQTHELRYTFSRELPPGDYITEIIIDDICTISASLTH